ncbi:MAG: GFA family protein [Mesorhizobium sp.]|uniref:GFA family protein n=1 Tax=Mesorhizobium sp. TaxID=1871066 RepID=UPI000FE7977D|nr:GFA family protein [Mesorhizobium sp.]RWM13093.1 MAG: GFA family protein [Mesorhizobium sp.]TIP72351.1 MAG: GFA family protein [Mesorhizobium sp.]TIQ11506.1 MAG: GFA family protein [Mesorhizobium sp.]TIR50798.1 MAG: GFA family protein [Mesorhizobium sp.]TJV96521.1 MAG: GFA family protein [Mesorhizobium sp.]
MAEVERDGGCLCGAVRFRVSGVPLRVGICHCQDCRRASGSFFTPFGVWPISAYEGSGEVKTFAKRSFCPRCGSHIAWLRDNEAEIMLGSLDMAPSDLIPEYELWVPRREKWLMALPWAEQFGGDRFRPSDP